MREKRKEEGLGTLSARSAQATLNMNAFIAGNADKVSDMQFQVSVMISVISESLRVHYRTVSWFNFFEKLKLRKALNANALAKNLSTKQVIYYNGIVNELEGLSKKKVPAEVGSQEKSQEQ